MRERDSPFGVESKDPGKAMYEHFPGFRIDQPGWPFAFENLDDLLRIPVCHIVPGVHGDTGRVIGRDDIIEGQQPVIQGWRLNDPDINPGTGDPAVCQSVCQCFLIDNATTGGVDQKGARLHKR